MTIETTIYSTLSADSSVRALVSTGSPLIHRIWPQVAEDNAAVPYVTWQVISHTTYNKLPSVPDTHRKLVQFNCISDDFDEAKSLAEAVRAALDSIANQTGGGDDYFPDTQNYRTTLDFAFIA